MPKYSHHIYVNNDNSHIDMSSAELIVRVQPHRSRYRIGDPVKLQVHLHTAKRSSEHRYTSSPHSSSPSTVSLGGGGAAPASSPGTMVRYDERRLCVDPLASSSSAISSSVMVTILSSTVQLVAYCCWNKTKFQVTEEHLRRHQVPFMSTTTTKAKNRSGGLSNEVAALLASPEVIGRNEVMTFLHLSKPAEPFRDVKICAGEPAAAAIQFFLPSPHDGIVLPTAKGNAVRIVYTVLTTVTWTTSFVGHQPTSPPIVHTTSIRVPVRVHAAEAVLPTLIIRQSGDDKDIRDASDDAIDNDEEDGCWVAIPAAPSPAVCPPLHDGIVPDVSPMGGRGVATAASLHHRTLSHNVSPSFSTQPFQSSDAHGHHAVSAWHTAMDAQVRYRLRSVSSPTDYLIRYNDVHTMNLLLESTTVPLGNRLCGAFCAVPTAAIRVARIVLTIECIEMTQKCFLAPGAVADAPVPLALRDSLGPSSETLSVMASQIVEEQEWYVLNALSTPFDISLTTTKFQQTMMSPLLTVAWIARWRFWCVDATGPQQLNVIKHAIKDLHQELELPLTIMPPAEGGLTARMGHPMYGIDTHPCQ